MLVIKRLKDILYSALFLSLHQCVKIEKNFQSLISAADSNGSSKIGWFNAHTINESRLAVTPIATAITSTPEECIIKCFYTTTDCRSVNARKRENVFLCELLASNPYENVLQLEHDTQSILYTAMSKCKDNPCSAEGGVCIPNYEDDTFVCRCKRCHTGRFCETKKIISELFDLC